MKKQKIAEFFSDVGFDYKEMEVNKFYPINGWEILTHSKNGNVWKNVTHIVRKESCVPVVVEICNSKICVSPEHRFWVKTASAESWIEAIDLVEENDDIYLFHETAGWVPATFTAGDKEIDILDMSVEDAESYYSNGVLSHNTMYGDPMTVPGGMAIPFHATTRIKLGAGAPILNAAKETIGINVSAKTVKNKVGPPFRTALFQIHFGKGIFEHEEIFDVLREAGPRIIGDVEISLTGMGAWKELLVVKVETGEILVSKKFHKPDFKEIMTDPQYEAYIQDMIENVMVRTGNSVPMTEEESQNTINEADYVEGDIEV